MPHTSQALAYTPNAHPDVTVTSELVGIGHHKRVRRRLPLRLPFSVDILGNRVVVGQCSGPLGQVGMFSCFALGGPSDRHLIIRIVGEMGDSTVRRCFERAHRGTLLTLDG